MRKVYALLLLLACMATTGLFAQNVTVNPGAGSYATLKEAFDAINNGTHTGAVTVTIVGNTTESAIASLNASGGTSSYTSVSITPSGARTISGNLASELVHLNGADNVTIDGINSGGNSLTISNTSTSNVSGTSTLRLSNDATNNLITRCSILGSSTMAVGTNGGNIFFHTAASGGTGNDNNTISFCNIGPAGSNLPTKGVYSSGTSTTTANYNNDNIITENNIFDFFGAATTSAGVYISGGSADYTISNNRFYQTGSRSQTTGAIHAAIQLASSNNGNITISGNTIGYASAAGTGTYTITNGATTGLRFYPIYISSHSTSVESFINNNIITAISLSGAQSGTTTTAPFIGIFSNSGLNSITGNTIGSLDGTTSINYSSTTTTTHDVYGIYSAGSGGTINITTNKIGTFTASSATAGIFLNAIRTPASASVPVIVEGNTIGGGSPNNIVNAGLSTSTGTRVIGIQATTGTFTINNNLIRNITVSSAATSATTAATIIGIMQSSSATGASFIISNNTIHSLSNTNTSSIASTVTGIYNTGSTTGTHSYLVYNNVIHSLLNESTSPSAVINGIYQASGLYSIYNNMVRLGRNAAGTSITNDIIIRGIYDAGTTAVTKVYHNSIFIGGQGVSASTANTFAFESLATSATGREYKNNIFANARSNAAGTGMHYAIKLSGTGTITIDRNDYYTPGTGGTLGSYSGTDYVSLAGWKVVIGQDANSYRVDPRFVNPTGSATTGSLKIMEDATPNPLESGGEQINTPNINTDFEGQGRPGPTTTNGGGTAPDVGADEFDGAPAVPMVYQTSNVVQQTGTAFAGNINQTILRLDIVTTGSDNPLVLTNFTLNAMGTDNISDLSNARIYYTGTSSTFGTNVPFGSDIPSLANYNVTGSQALVEGTNYFWITYDLASGATAGNKIDGEIIDFTLSSVVINPSNPAPSGWKTIVGAMAGNFNVGQGQTAPNFVTLLEAFANLKARGISSDVTLTLTNDAATPYNVANGEDFPMIIDPITGAGPSTVTIRPAAGLNPVITGNVSANAIFRLNGADYIVFDGSNNGTTSQNLTISNTSTSTTSAVIWGQTNASDGATNNTIKNTIISGASPTTTLVGIGFGSTSISISGLGNGNNNNTIQNNQVGNVQYGIYSQGASAATKNTGNVIRNNSIGGTAPNLNKAGIYVGFEDGINISGNSISGISNTGDVAAITLGAISISTSTTGNEVTNATVSKNNIGSVVCTGGSSSVGIYSVNGTGGVNTIDNNVITGVIGGNTTSDLTAGIYVAGSNGSTNVYFNSVSMTGARPGTASSFSFALAIGGSTPVVDIQNNILYNSQTSGSSTGKSHAIGLHYSSAVGNYANLTSNYNDLFVEGANAVFARTGSLTGPSSGTERVDLAAWNTETGQDAPGTSISVDPLFNSATNLKPQTGSQVVGAGVDIPGFTTDFEGATRGNPPTIGAYESAADVAGPEITYTLLTNTGSTANRTLVANITDVTGVATAGNAPRIYYRKGNSGSYFAANATSVSGSDYTFTIDYSNVGGITESDIVQYYVAAQDVLGNMSTSPTGGTGVNPPGTTAPSTPNQYKIVASYVWQGATGDFQGAGNWSPIRTTPDVTDLLVFDGAVVPSATVTNIPSQTLSKLSVINNANVKFQSAGTATITLSGTGEVLNIEAGSSLDINSVSALTLAFAGAGPTGTVNGTLGTSGVDPSYPNIINVTGAVLTVNGTFKNGGTLTGASATTLIFNTNSTYEHARNAGTIPTASINANSGNVNLALTGIITAIPSMPASCKDLLYNSPNQTSANLSFSSALATITGNITIESTGSGSFKYGAGNTTIPVGGNLVVNNGNMQVTSSTNTLSVAGNCTINGGVVDLSASSLKGTLNVAGDFLLGAGGTLTESSTSTTSELVFNGTADQAVSIFGTVNNTTNIRVNKASGNLNLNSDFNLIAGVSFTSTLGKVNFAPGKSFNIAGTANFGGQSINLKSDATGTARLGTITGTLTGATNVTVERYIPANGRRAWRLLGAPLQAATAPTIFNSWQEGGAATSTGTHITQASGAGTDGFDASSISSGSASIKQYDGVNLISPSNTDVNKVTDNGAAYFLFVRGDRTISLNTPGQSSNTVLRMTGTINQGNLTVGLAAPGFSLIPNPYPSAVDFESIFNGNTLSGTYYIYDANLGSIGGYRTITRTGANTYSSTPTTGDDNTMRFIRSGQAFFIPDNMQVNFTEGMKTESTPVVNVYRTGAGTEEMTIDLRVMDGSANGVLFDGVRAKYNNSYSAAVDANDAPKLNNFNENLAITRNNVNLAVEQRPLVDAADTIFLKLWNTGVKNYRFDINPSNFSSTANLDAYLIDGFLNTTTPVSLHANTMYDFSITSNSASAAENRFMIVYRSSAPLPVNFTNVKAFTKNAGIQVEWNVAAEVDVVKYEVEKSANGTSFDKAGTVTAINSKVYNWFDATPNNGNNYYRIKVINKDNTSSYSNVVNVKMGNTKGDIAVYPNPVKGNVINVQFTDQEKGTYNVQLFNNLGQQVYTSRIVHQGGSASEALQLNSALSKGVYQLVITTGDRKITQQVIAE